MTQHLVDVEGVSFDFSPQRDCVLASMTKGSSITLEAVPDVPLIMPGTDIAETIITTVEDADMSVVDGDIFVIAQKIVSKAEDRYVLLDTVTPSAQAIELASKADKDPRLVEAILSESNEVVRCEQGVIVVEHRLGHVMANAGIDASNLGPFDDGRERVLLLPRNPDATCVYLRGVIEGHFACRIGVLISDSVGRAWRNGTVGLALGVAGPPPIWNRVGEDDLTGRQLRVTEVALADQIAAAAALVMGEGAEGRPIVKVGGVPWQPSESGAGLLLRSKDRDLFR